MMKNDYLWDKTGGDAEIEGLEGVLSAFRYKPTAPPVLPREVAGSEPRRFPWWKLSLGFAVPACILVAIAAGFWINIRTDSTKIAAEPSVQQSQTTKDEIVAKPENTDPEIKAPELPKPVKTVFMPRNERKRLSPERAVKRRPKKPIETLTAEEKFAYDQLRLALSITGSKLKVVSDTVNRTED